MDNDIDTDDDTDDSTILTCRKLRSRRTSDLRGRVLTKIPALDHVLGGGLVEGSTTLFTGRPNTGKTTLTLQMLNGLGARSLYVTGEETRENIEAKAQRVGAMSDRICVIAERRIEEILEQARSMRAQALAIDTIQMLSCGHVKGRPGLPAQLRECTARLIDYAGATGTTLWLIGHLTACGDIAGPVTIAHSIDVVLRLDQEDDERILRCPGRNKFGPTNAVGRLELTAEGFVVAKLKKD
jgi:DNA repair protein RadA/Sms